MTISAQIRAAAENAIKHLFPETDLGKATVSVNQTKTEFKGDYTIVLFPFVKALRMKPDELGKQIGDYLLNKCDLFAAYEIVSGFLNMTLKDNFWTSFLLNHFNDVHYGDKA